MKPIVQCLSSYFSAILFSLPAHLNARRDLLLRPRWSERRKHPINGSGAEPHGSNCRYSLTQTWITKMITCKGSDMEIESGFLPKLPRFVDWLSDLAQLIMYEDEDSTPGNLYMHKQKAHLFLI